MKNVKLFVLPLFVGLLLLVSQSCSLFVKDVEPLKPEPLSGELSTGQSISLLQGNISESTSQTVGSAGEVLNLKGLNVALKTQSTAGIQISAAEINSHSFGELITPVSPLITIHTSNQGGEEVPLYIVTIPIAEPVADDEFMMAFYYVPQTGKLEGIPTVRYSSNSITIATTHFSDFFISKVRISLLPDNIRTGFRPDVHGWPYTNYGTYYRPQGICAGMSLTAMYIYAHQNDLIYTSADNNRYPESPTPAFGEDDVDGIIYGTYGQVVYGNYLAVWRSNIWLDGLDDALTYRSFAYSMMVTAEPQYVRISSSTSSGGHAMVVYAIAENQLFVYDPNYPGNTNRIINFRGKTSGNFDPYNSGADAEAIANGYGVAYDLITYASKSALISMDDLETGYTLYKSRELYKNSFANESLELVLYNEKNQLIARSKETNLISSSKKVKLKFYTTLTISGGEAAIFYDSDFKVITNDIIELDENKEKIIGVNVLGKNTIDGKS